MTEPEGLLIEGARIAAASARDLWWRMRPPGEPAVLALRQVTQRIQLLLHALHGVAIPIVPADPAPPPSWLARILGRAPRHLLAAVALPATDGERIWLPRVLPAREGERLAVERYRLLAVEQAARVVEGFAGAHPHDAPPIEQDLYRLAEAAALDRRIAQALPGLAGDLRGARTAMAMARPPLERLRAAERAIEQAFRDVLAADPALPPRRFADVDTPDDARAWARREARDLGTDRRYRGVTPVILWGEARRARPSPGSLPGQPSAEPPTAPRRAAALHRTPRARQAQEDEDDASPGTWMVRADDPMESVEDPMGLQRPADQDTSADPRELADSLSELPEARVVRTPDAPREVLASDDVPRAHAAESGREGSGPGITYPEWDHRVAAYRDAAVVVRPGLAPEGSGEWVERVIERHAAMVRRVRRRFDRLRPRRVRLGRQPDGPDVDLDTYVTAFADWRAGSPGDDRLYMAIRPARRDLAIAVLVDVSASTDAWVAGNLRIVDVEKEALIVLLEALGAMGDRHVVLAFSGQGPRGVRVLTVTGFGEGATPGARRRIAALEPDGYTRVGAAIRHASALLTRERARHRLLLLLSDGKPNDVDEYAGRYGIEDTRQAVAEARLDGLLPFCLTVDREAPAYLPAIFGPRGFAVLPRPELLPTVLVDVVRSIVS